MALGADSLERGLVPGVALVVVEAPPRVVLLELAHQPVPGDLGQDGGRRDRQHGGVALDDRMVLVG